MACGAYLQGDETEFESLTSRLAGLASSNGRRLPESLIVTELSDAVESCWQMGWRPRDLVEIIGRNKTAAHLVLTKTAIVDQSYFYRRIDDHVPERVFEDAPWYAELDSIYEGHAWWSAVDSSYIEQWAARDRIECRDAIRIAIETVCTLRLLRRLPKIGPAPTDSLAEVRLASPAGRRLDSKIASRIRALLAKAESSEYPEEAEAFSAKAQELMARHAIDHAMVYDRADTAEEPTQRRIWIDNPYANAKSLLCHYIADANRSRSIWSEAGFVTVVGYPQDLDFVELLYSSLLVQATRAMVAHGSVTDVVGRSRTRSFRKSFLIAFADRIGHRLRVTADESVAAGRAEHGEALLPVLASRQDRLDAHIAETLGDTCTDTISVSNAAGYAAGTIAGDMADVAFADSLSQ